MDVVTEQTFDWLYPIPVRDRFWDIVRRTLSDVFNHPATAADELRREIEENAPVAEQILVYHDEPLNIAADLASVKQISDAQLDAYRDLVGSDEPQSRGLPP